MDKQINKKVLDEIMKILYDNNLTVADAKEILYIASKKLMDQKLMASS